MKLRDVFSKPVFTISNFLSVSRVLLLLPFMIFSSKYGQEPDRLEWLFVLLVIIFLAVLTDYLDGYLARRLNQETMLGRYLDPVCDKIATIGALFMLVWDFSFPLWIFLYYIIREILGVWLGTFLFFKRDIQGSPNQWGKWGVGLVSICVLWYLSKPWLATKFEPEHWLLQPDIAAFVLLGVLTGGIISYSVTYWKVVFGSDSAK